MLKWDFEMYYIHLVQTILHPALQMLEAEKRFEYLPVKNQLR